MGWIPRSGLDTAGGLVWLPRMIEKARRYEAGRDAGRDLMDGYLYGDNDYIDQPVIRFLRTDDAAISALVRTEADDAAVGRILVDRSGRSAEECRTFSAQLRRRLANFALMEADEGRMAPGPRRTLLRFVYNRVIMPPVYAWFKRAERKRGRA